MRPCSLDVGRLFSESLVFKTHRWKHKCHMFTSRLLSLWQFWFSPQSEVGPSTPLGSCRILQLLWLHTRADPTSLCAPFRSTLPWGFQKWSFPSAWDPRPLKHFLRADCHSAFLNFIFFCFSPHRPPSLPTPLPKTCPALLYFLSSLPKPNIFILARPLLLAEGKSRVRTPSAPDAAYSVLWKSNSRSSWSGHAF